MERVLAQAIMENLEDLWAQSRGLLKAEEVRRVTVNDALADTVRLCSPCPRA